MGCQLHNQRDAGTLLVCLNELSLVKLVYNLVKGLPFQASVAWKLLVLDEIVLEIVNGFRV